MVIGIVLIGIGLIFFAQALGFLKTEEIDVLWPLLLVVLGISLLSHKVFGHECTGSKKCWYCQTVDFGGGKRRKQ